MTDRRLGFIVPGAVLCAAATPARAAEPGDVVQTDNFGMNVASWNVSRGTKTTVADEQVLSEFVGAHAFAWKDVRLGMNLQFSEQLAPAPKNGERFRTFALLPQIGWIVHPPFFVAGVFTFAPRSAGGANTVLGVQAVAGVGLEIAHGVSLGAAVEVPYNFFPDETVGITPLIGASFLLLRDRDGSP